MDIFSHFETLYISNRLSPEEIAMLSAGLEEVSKMEVVQNYGYPSVERWKCRFLTFDDIELKAGDRIRIYTCKGEDHTETGIKTGKHYKVIYWNLNTPIWNIPSNSIEIMERGDSYSVAFR